MTATLASLVRMKRLRRGWTHRGLAEAAGISERTIWRIENGAACHDLTAAALAEVLDLDLATVLSLAASATNATDPVAESDSESRDFPEGAT